MRAVRQSPIWKGRGNSYSMNTQMINSELKKEPLNDFTEILRGELKSRTQRNPKYSLRAFARDLGISPARLSRILSARAVSSRAMTLKIGSKLGFKDEKLDWFIALVESRYGKNPTEKAAAQALVDRYSEGILTKKLTVKNPFYWSWYHFTIRRMTQLKDFRVNFDWIAKALGMRKAHVKKAVDELLMEGALMMVNGKLEIHENYSVQIEGDKALFCRRMEKSLYPRKLKSILGTNRERSHHARHFFALNHAQMEEIKRLIRSFENQVDDLTYKTQEPDDVYLLSIDFCALTQTK